MLTYKGKYATAYVMIDNIDPATVAQIYEFINHYSFKGKIIIVMPDTHKGNGAVIGFTMEMGDTIIPNIVGVDIDCGMYFVRLEETAFKNLQRTRFDRAVRRHIPMGTKVRGTPAINMEKDFPWSQVNKEVALFTEKFASRYGSDHNFSHIKPKITFDWFKNTLCKSAGTDVTYAINSIGTLGGGNHFIEFGYDENRQPCVIVHSGSRNLGKKTAEFWQHVARKALIKIQRYEVDTQIAAIKATEPKDKWQRLIMKAKAETKVVKSLEHLTGSNMYFYLVDCIFLYHYSLMNRLVMMGTILDLLERPDFGDPIHTIHNYVDHNDFIIRKGAISSYAGQKMIIPFNMEDGTLIVEGKSNPDWNFSAPHGAGRILARGEAKRKVDVAAAEASMKAKNIYASVIPADEAKAAYKDPAVIEEAIAPTATILHKIRPILNMKGRDYKKKGENKCVEEYGVKSMFIR